MELIMINYHSDYSENKVYDYNEFVQLLIIYCSRLQRHDYNSYTSLYDL